VPACIDRVDGPPVVVKLLQGTQGIGVVLASGLISLVLERWEKFGLTRAGLVLCAKAEYQSFESLGQSGRLTPQQTAYLYAMFTDVQTYFDQRSYAFAWRTLTLIKRALLAASDSKQQSA